MVSPLQARAVVAALALVAAGPWLRAEIQWFDRSFEDALSTAGDQDKMLFVYFWMEGSQHCETLYQQTLQSPPAQEILQSFVCLSVNAADAQQATVIRHCQVSIVPSMFFLSPQGVIEDAIMGAVPTNEFVDQGTRIKAGRDTVSELRGRVDSGDEQALLLLASKLQYLGDQAGFRRIIDTIRAEDPLGSTLAGAQLLLRDLLQKVAATPAEGASSEDPFAPVYEQVTNSPFAEVKLEGWEWLASQEAQRGKTAESRQARAMAYRHAPEDRKEEIGLRMVQFYFLDRQELDRDEKKLMREVASKIAKEVERRAKKIKDPNDPNFVSDEQKSMAYSALAQAHSVDGKHSKALSVMEKALSLSPGNGEHERAMRAIRAAAEE